MERYTFHGVIIMCRQAKDAVLMSMKLAIVLLISQLMLLFGPLKYDTYYNLQILRAMPELIISVLLIGALGAGWLQSLWKRSGR